MMTARCIPEVAHPAPGVVSAEPVRLPALLAGMQSYAATLPDLPIARVTLDSRRVGSATLFLACQGMRAHGLDHAHAAVAAGAVAIVAEPSTTWSIPAINALAHELGVPVIPLAGLKSQAGVIAARCYGDPSAALELIGVTGTNGKTSVSQFIAQASMPDLSCALIGTLGQGFPGVLNTVGDGAGMTTPDAPELQRLLAELRQQGAAAVAMEVSSHALAQQRVSAVRFDYAVLTNLTRDHLDYHGTMEAYAAAKARLFHSPGLRWAILNADDAFGWTLRTHLAAEVKRAFYSLGSGAARLECESRGDDLLVMATAIERHPRALGLQVRARVPWDGDHWQSGELQTPLLGRFNAANLLATLTLLLARGMALDTALWRLSLITGVPGRMECFGTPGEPLCVVDYAHTPDALEQALSELRAHCPAGRLLVVFGCGGERDTGKRALMGRVAERLADHVILTDDNPRHEDGDAIIDDIQAGMSETGNHVEVERQRGLAIRRALLLAGAGDAVLIAGKGHETEQDMGELKLRFSDRAQIMQALGEWRGKD
jgi:UDP-N-acetylmuramoyl-L-alanyl-D-glutamate--2,6-diaminopimelate ligase